MSQEEWDERQARRKAGAAKRAATWAAKTPAEKLAISKKKTATRAAKWKSCGNCGERYHSRWLIGHDHDADPVCSTCFDTRDASLLKAIKERR